MSMQINSFSDHFAPAYEFIYILPKSPRPGEFKVVHCLGENYNNSSWKIEFLEK